MSGVLMAETTRLGEEVDRSIPCTMAVFKPSKCERSARWIARMYCRDGHQWVSNPTFWCDEHRDELDTEIARTHLRINWEQL
jgi:hypothetical protein